MVLTEFPIHVDQLCVGVYVRLDLQGKRNPFLRSSFKIKNEKQIEKIRKLGLTHVNCDLSKSDQLPIPAENLPGRSPAPIPSPSAQSAPKTPVSAELLGLKKETIERNKERKAAFARCEKKYDEAVSSVVTILRRASGRAADAAAEASKVVEAMVGTFLSDRDVVVNLMSSKPTEEKKNYHALNVTVLSMMVGKEVNLNAQHMHSLGMGALFHDIGKGRVNIKHMERGKATTVRRAEESQYREHPQRGENIVADMPDFPKAARGVVLQHHEAVDGSGFPARLAADKISPLARIVAVVDAYDNLLGESDAEGQRTPHEALKIMYATKKGLLDERILGLFIRLMGVYPAGCVVQLSNGMIGMVVSTNPRKATRPSVMIYHPDIPKKEALIVDLTVETELEIKKNLKPESLGKEVFAYLSPSRQISYYADTLPEGG
ncbi:MAG: HD-GYP domain-containing protein [Desulfovibrionaceae bacterium]